MPDNNSENTLPWRIEFCNDEAIKSFNRGQGPKSFDDLSKIALGQTRKLEFAGVHLASYEGPFDQDELYEITVALQKMTLLEQGSIILSDNALLKSIDFTKPKNIKSAIDAAIRSAETAKQMLAPLNPIEMQKSKEFTGFSARALHALKTGSAKSWLYLAGNAASKKVQSEFELVQDFLTSSKLNERRTRKTVEYHREIMDIYLGAKFLSSINAKIPRAKTLRNSQAASLGSALRHILSITSVVEFSLQREKQDARIFLFLAAIKLADNLQSLKLDNSSAVANVVKFLESEIKTPFRPERNWSPIPWYSHVANTIRVAFNPDLS